MIIKIKNLRLKTIIGFHPWESELPQEIVINASLKIAGEAALQSDKVSDSLDYDLLVAKIKKLVAASHFKLVEKMAGEIMVLLMEEQKVQECQLEVEKIGALENLEAFSVVLVKKRTDDFTH